MASLVLGAAGAFVGSFFGPLGTSIGWAIGAGVGNALFPSGGGGQNGPRLSDLKVHNSSYGQMIPIIYGTVRIAGNMIWTTDFVEHEHTSGGGKGGPEPSKTWTYTCSYAVLICAGPIAGLLRIWADSRLVYDIAQSDPADFPFTLYLGTETQLPDPTIEAEEGAGNVSAHRGLAYIVFTDQEMEQFSNRIPSLTFEVFTAGSTIPWRYASFEPYNTQDGAVGGIAPGPQTGALENGVLVISQWTGGVGSTITFELKTFDLEGNELSYVTETGLGIPAPNAPQNTHFRECLNNPHIAFAYAGGQGNDTPQAAMYYEQNAVWLGTGGNYYAYGNETTNPVYSAGAEAVYLMAGNTTATLLCYPAPGGVPSSENATAALVISSYANVNPTRFGAGSWTITVDDEDNVWALGLQSSPDTYVHLFKLDSDLNVLHTWLLSELPTGFADTSTVFTVWNGILYFSNAGNGNAYYINDDFTFTLADTGVLDESFLIANPGQYTNMISLGNGLVLVGGGITSLQPRASAVTLASIVSDLSVRSGLTTDQIDVSQLTDLVDGYIIPAQMDARSAIQPLQIAWPFDAVEHDVLVNFPRRGVNGIVATLDDNDLGAFIPPGTPPAPLGTQRLQEVDLPRIFDVTFINHDTDHQNGEARAQRLITTSELTTSVQLPIVMSSQKALSVCNEQIYNAWIERERFSLSLSRRWLLLEPADMIQASGRTMRITRKVEQADGIVRIDAAAMSLAVYQHLAPPVDGVGMPGGGGTPPTTPPVIQGTDALLLDLPLIRDTDNPFGWYAAFAGATQPSWPGCTLYKSIDGGTSFNPEISTTLSDSFGDCTTTLGDFGGGNIFDETNSLTVELSVGSDTLSSVTRLAVLNGANMAAVGIPGETGIREMEIIQYRDATLIGTRTYLLTGLLRGRRGTEWMIPLHTSGETFVSLPTGTNVLGSTSELYLSRQYRAVTFGRALATAAIQNFTNYGMAVLPYAPCNLGGGRLVNGDLLLTWTRRTRIGGGWLPFTDVPLSEPLEWYQVNIYSDGTYATLVRQLPTAVESVTYDLATQTVDFGSPSPLPLYWGVQQLGTFAYGTEARGAT